MRQQNSSKFIRPHTLNTAVLFLVFNRPDTTKLVFEAIRQAKPLRLYVAADGARSAVEGEDEKVREVREYILNNVDWPCEVKTLFRQNNLGCGKAVSEAITWFFENEEMGIILEDDCLPGQSFFFFCQLLLDKYRNEKKVMQINGSCFISDLNIKESYFFSKYNHIWGWATWRRAWARFNMRYPDWEESFENINLFNSNDEKKYWKKTFKSFFSGHIDTWDYPWTFSIWINNGLSIYPKFNMIRNIGFGPGATHTSSDSKGVSGLRIYELAEKDLIHPEQMLINTQLDLKDFKIMFKPHSLGERIVNKLKKVFKNNDL